LPLGWTPCIGRRDHHSVLPASGRPRLLGEVFLTGEGPVRRPAPVVVVCGRRLSVEGGLGEDGQADLGAVAVDLLDVEFGEEVDDGLWGFRTRPSVLNWAFMRLARIR